MSTNVPVLADIHVWKCAASPPPPFLPVYECSRRIQANNSMNQRNIVFFFSFSTAKINAATPSTTPPDLCERTAEAQSVFCPSAWLCSSAQTPLHSHREAMIKI